MDHSVRDPNVMTVKTLRDEFAMAALTGMLANHVLVKAIMKENGTKSLGAFFEENIYEYADLMLKARKRG